MSLFGKISDKVKTELHRKLRLNSLRKSNPFATINSHLVDRSVIGRGAYVGSGSRLTDARLGQYVAILDGVSIDSSAIKSLSYVSYNSRIVECDIGKFCSIGPNVQIGLAPHPVRGFVSTYPAFFSTENSGCPIPFVSERKFDDSVPRTTIENDVWIGSDVIIPGGVRIANGAVIAAGSVVVKDVPPYAIVGGNPARLIRSRFDESQVLMLNEIKWWEWSVEEIKENADLFCDMDAFLDKYGAEYMASRKDV